MVAFTVRLPDEIHAAIRDEAHRTYTSMNTIVTDALRSHLDGYDQQ